MPTFHTPIPNPFTMENIIEISTKLDDGRRINRKLTEREYIEWRQNGSDLEDLIDDDEDGDG